MDFLTHLRSVNTARLDAWANGQDCGALFHATELAGEVGEALNVVKKLHREAMGWRGSRASVDHLRSELADVLICLDKLAMQYDIDLAQATVDTFNATSDKVGLPHELLPVAALVTPTPAGELREVYRHKVRGTLYEVIASAELQAATGDVEEGAILTIYQGADGKVWARRAREFGDGRFERVSSALAQSGSGEGV